jgi:hypothetical protein
MAVSRLIISIKKRDCAGTEIWENREEIPAYLLSPRLVRICRKRAAIFPQPSFRDSPFLYPVFAIITGVLKHLFTEPPSMEYRLNMKRIFSILVACCRPKKRVTADHRPQTKGVGRGQGLTRNKYGSSSTKYTYMFTANTSRVVCGAAANGVKNILS